MPLQATSGAASYDAFGGGVPVVPNYIEDVFSTWLYTGNATTNTITNNIDLSGKGGMVWIKGRDTSAQSATSPHRVFDTLRGANRRLETNSSAAQSGASGVLSSFNSTGFSIDTNRFEVNGSGSTYASWTFREQPKFFDIVTYTGNSASNRAISHLLGSTPGCIIFKCTSSAGNWKVYHNTQSFMADLDSTAGFNQSFSSVGFVSTNATTFTVTGASDINTNGETYVAYLFAHDAGGFGLTGTDNVISCGSFTGSTTVELGFEPQWILIKSTAASDWEIYDTMRGCSLTGHNYLMPNRSDAETAYTSQGVYPTATGFVNNAYWGGTCIYIAIRRGPMKVPTSGTSVFGLNARAGTSAATSISGGSFTTDLIVAKSRGTAGTPFIWANRLTNTLYLESSSTSAQSSSVGTFPTNATWDIQQGIKIGSGPDINDSADTFINYFLGRAPSVMDVVCYTGTGSATTFTHNLGVAPELMIVKSRSNALSGMVYPGPLATLGFLRLFVTDIGNVAVNNSASTIWDNTRPTSSVFSVGTDIRVNGEALTYVAYLFATCAGVSKVGKYTGTGTTLQIDCGFTGGARFVLIKRTDSTGDWYVWDSARGIVSGNDPYLLLNTTDAEVTNTDYGDTYSAGFEISSTAPSAINASGGTFIFLAIA